MIGKLERLDKVILTNMCMIYDDKGNVLVENKIRKQGSGLIFPGGHVEERESIVDSIIREIKEETGLTISNLEFCGIKDWVEEDGSRYMFFLYRTSKYSGKLISSSEGEVFWMSLEELKKKDTLWHLNLMLEIFCNNSHTELYFDRNGSDSEPSLK